MTVNDVRIIGTITIVALTAIVVIGLEWETKVGFLFCFFCLHFT